MTMLRITVLKGLILLVLTSIMCLWSGSAAALSTISISSAGGTSFDLQGIDITGAAALDITISYDASGLSAPVVTQGNLVSGAMMAVNTNTPGAIRIALIRTTPVQGTGSIASIVFSGTGGTGIKALSASLADINGKSISSTVLISNSAPVPDVDIESTATTKTTSQSSSGSGSGSTPAESSTGGSAAGSTSASGSGSQIAVLPGGIVQTSGQTTKGQAEQQPMEETMEETPLEKQAAPEIRVASRGSDDQAALPAKKIFTQESVLDRFRNFTGPRSAQAFIMLFRQESMIGFKQIPGVVISDGVSPVRVSFISSSDVKTAPDVALTNARLLSLKRDADYTNTWVADVVPEKGALSASLAVSQGDLNMIFPIVTAPACNIDITGKGITDENAFSLFLNNRTREQSKYDMNKDGKVDFVDDYIFTANYIRSLTAAPSKPVGKK